MRTEERAERGRDNRQVALITGSTRGIGEATARRLARRGVHVVVNSARSAEAGLELAAELEGTYIQRDVSAEHQAEELVHETVARLGALDLVINNAGTTEFIELGDLQSVTAETWDKILSLNLLAPWFITRAAAPWLRSSSCGAVVNVSSVAGTRPVGSSIPYGVSKAALHHLTAFLAKALAPDVRVNAIAPGVLATPWHGPDGPPTELNVPLGGAGNASAAAEACEYLLFATYATGSVLTVDGGLTLT